MYVLKGALVFALMYITLSGVHSIYFACLVMVLLACCTYPVRPFSTPRTPCIVTNGLNSSK